MLLGWQTKFVATLVVLCLFFLQDTESTHFRGVRMSWAPPNKNDPSVVDITFTVVWLNKAGATYCDDQKIASGGLLDPVVYPVSCDSGCAPNPKSIFDATAPCVNYSVQYQWSEGVKIYNFVPPPPQQNFVFSWQGSGWSNTTSQGIDNAWQCLMTMNLAIRPDTNLINSSPYSRLAAIPVLPSGFNYTFCLPVFDDDHDDVRCRWATGYVECGDACQPPPGIILDQDCTMLVDASLSPGFYTVVIQVEDFPTPGATVALSSVPLQFYLEVTNTTTYDPSLATIGMARDCRRAPYFTSPFPSDCLVIRQGETLPVRVTVHMGSFTSTLVSVTMNSSLTMQASTPVQAGVLDYAITITLSGASATFSFETVCYFATDDMGLVSDSRCFTLDINPAQPTAQSISFTPSSSPGGYGALNITFDRPISLPPAQPGGANSGGGQQEPTVFLYTSNNELYTSDVIVVMITVDNSLIIAVPMARIPYGTYYVLLNASAVNALSTGPCISGSLPVSDPNRLRFTYAPPTTPPVSTLPTTAAVTTVVVTTQGPTTVGVTTVNITTQGPTTVGVTTQGSTTIGLTTANLTTQGATTAGVTTVAITTQQITTNNITEINSTAVTTIPSNTQSTTINGTDLNTTTVAVTTPSSVNTTEITITSSDVNSNITTEPLPVWSPRSDASTSSLEQDQFSLYIVLIVLGVAFAIALGVLATVAIKTHLSNESGVYYPSA